MMTRDEFIKKIEHYHGRVGDRDIVLDHYSTADFDLGCYYDKVTKTWKVYENDERGMRGIRLETVSEEKALDRLYSLIEFENETELRYREIVAKKRGQSQG